MRAAVHSLKSHLALVVTLAVFLGLVCHCFERFPNGWDQAEYALCLKKTYLPHSPYLLFFVAGKLLHLVAPPPVALSLLSAASGVAALCLFYGVGLRMLGRSSGEAGRDGRGVATVATALLGLSFAFVRQASTQEVYVFHTFLVLLSLFVLLGDGRGKLVWSGVVFGCAMGAHNASLLLLPAMLVAAAGEGRGRRVRSVVSWLAPAVLTSGLLAAVLWLLVPPPEGWSSLGYVVRYLRGAAPRLPQGALAAPGFFAWSGGSLWHRLFSLEVAMSRLPRASGPLGLSVFHLLAALAGLVLSVRVDRWKGLLWLVYPLPFLGYEVALGRNLDYGLYVPFVFPPVCYLSALAVGSASRVRGLRRSGVWLQGALVALLLAPSAYLHWRHWGSVAREEVGHYSSSAMAAMWMARHLPGDAVVIQPAGERQPNILAYYWARQYACCTPDESILFQSRGRFTPLNETAFEALTTDRLRALLASGRPVYAFGPDPLARCRRRVIDNRAFEWRRAAVIDLEEVKLTLRIAERVRRQVAAGRVVLYRGSIRRAEGARAR